MPIRRVNAPVSRLSGLFVLVLAARRVAHPADQFSGWVEQPGLIWRAVIPDTCASAEAEAAGLRMHFVGVDADRVSGSEGYRRELECG